MTHDAAGAAIYDIAKGVGQGAAGGAEFSFGGRKDPADLPQKRGK
jgi:hypothetical protein